MKSIADLIGDFANMNRTPDFKVKTAEITGNAIPLSRAGGGRRHSLNLAVGVSDEIPPFNIARRTNRRQSVACTSDEGIDADATAWAKSKDQGRRRQSAPVISQFDELHRKLAHLRQRHSLSCAEEEDEETEEKARSRRGSKQAFMNMIEAAKANKELTDSEQQTDLRRRKSSSSPKTPEKNYAHRASVIFIDDNEVSSIHSSINTPI